MIKIKALNESEDSSEDDVSQSYLVTREAEEDALKRVYEEAIRHLSAGEEELAKQLLLKLNESLSEISVKQKCSSEAFFHKLQYSTLKNLGMITNDINYYLDALELDATDVSLWLKTGRRAALLLNYQLARNCYESAFRLSPQNWIVIDRLIETTFVVHDLHHCFRHCCYAIDKDPSYTKAIILFNECLSLHPILHKDMDEKYKKYMGDYDPEEYERVVGNLRQLKAKRRQQFEEDRIRQEAKRPRLTLFLDKNSSSLTLSSIGSKLKAIYDRIKKNNWFPSTPIDINFDSGHNSQTDSCGNESGSANTSADESQSTATEPKEKGLPSNDKELIQTAESESESTSRPKLKRSHSARNSNSFSEFVDKRRSSRVKNILNKSKDIDERNVSESILDLLPESFKTAVIEERPITPEASEEQKNIFKCINICEKTESDYINGFFDRIKSKKARSKFLMIDHLIEMYLREVGLTKNLIIPSVFTELYAFYRQSHELPCGPLTVIGRDIDVEQIWMCLTANELKFNRNEVMFLTQILFPLELTLDSDHYKEFVVRLSMLRGTKENDNDFLETAIDILVTNEIEVMASNKVVIKYDAIKSILDSQSRENMSQMMAEHHFEELIKILRDKPESELTDEEINLLNDAIVSSELWQKGIDILCTRSELNNECLSTIRQCLETGKRARLKHPLAVKLVKLAAEGYSVLPWICLYWGLIAEGLETNNAKSPIIKFLKLGHQYLGTRGTCTSHGGEFLLLALNHFLENEVEEEIIRCFTCLFNFPLRKMSSNPSVSSLNIHKSPHIQLKWEHCEQLYHYFAPEELPEYDSVLRQTGITQEIEGLFMRIVELIPSNLKPDDKTEPIVKYIENGDSIPEDLPQPETTLITETIYYLLADYYFKNTEFRKARLYYLNDLSLNPNRFDSWAASALARTWEVDQQLLSGEVNDQSFYDLTMASQRCFQKALKLERGNTKLWLEFGHFVYNVSSSASRFRKTSLFKSQEEFKIQSEDMIKIAKNCFESALKTDEGEELWLPYYMLGKVMEKCSLSSGASALLTAIKYYEWAELCLYADGTSYPKKIQYYNPPQLAVEALEIHYRIHASILKYLTFNHQKFSTRVLKRLKMHLVRALRSPFTKQSSPSSTTPTIPTDHDYVSSNALAGSSRIACDAVTELVTDMVDSVVLKEQKVDIITLRTELIVMCLNAMRRCVDRYPAHYKSIYRLASYYHMVSENTTAKQLLLGMGNQKGVSICLPTGADSLDNAKLIPGLFAERKGNNMFNGIWRIPIDDIDRPGSFSAHMFRSTWLLIRVCTFTSDYHQLCTIAIQLSRAPEAGKKFLRDSDRQILAKLAFDSCVLMLKSRLGTMTVGTRDWTVVDVQKIFDRFIKSGIFVKESNEMIRELFTMSRR